MVATSATRDAANRDVFFAMTADVLGAVVPGAVAEVITGTEEAALSFHGAVDELDPAQRLSWSSTSAAVPPKWCSGSRDVDASFSADIGCVRLDRALPALRSADRRPEIAAAREVVREGLGQALRRGARRQARVRGWGWQAP